MVNCFLSEADHNAYLKSGYVVSKQGFLAAHEFNEFKKVVYETIHKFMPVLKSRCISEVQELEPALLRWMLHPSFIRLAKELLGPNVAFCTSNIFFKKAQTPEVFTWHRDFHMVIPKAPASARNKAINIVFSVDEAPVESGCLEYIPGSQLEDIEFSDGKAPNALAYDSIIKIELLKGQPVLLPLHENQVVAHNALTVHQSGPNKSDRNRALVSIRFFSTDESQLLSLYTVNFKNAQMVSGRDYSGKNLAVSPFYLD